MNVVFTLARKDALLLLRDRTGFALTFLSPLIYAIFFGVIFGSRSIGLQPFHIVVVDEDNSGSSKELIETLKQIAVLHVELADKAAAVRIFKLGNADALVAIPKGFATHGASAAETELPIVEVAIRPDQTTLANFLGGLVPQLPSDRDGSSAISSNRLVGSNLASGSAAPPLTTANGIGSMNVYAIAFPQGITWGALGCVATFGLSLVIERKRGTLSRLRVAPVTRTQILAGKAGACFVALLILEVSLFAISRFAFGVRPQSVGLLLMAMMSISISFVGIMMFLSVWGRTESAASSIIWTVLLGMSMLGGGMVPRFLMPAWLQRLGDFSPVRWAILAMDGAVWRGFTATEMLQPCAILILVGLGSFAVGALVFRWVN